MPSLRDQVTSAAQRNRVIDDAEQVEGQRAVAARPAGDVGSEPVVGHQREELDRRGHELVDAGMQLVDRELRAAILVQADEVDDLLGVLAEDVLVATRQDGDGPEAELLQLGHPVAFKNIHRNEFDPTDR